MGDWTIDEEDGTARSDLGGVIEPPGSDGLVEIGDESGFEMIVPLDVLARYVRRHGGTPPASVRVEDAELLRRLIREEVERLAEVPRV